MKIIITKNLYPKLGHVNEALDTLKIPPSQIQNGYIKMLQCIRP